MRILIFDPSGNWSKREGKGSTGWATFEDGKVLDFGEISAEKYSSLEEYWFRHVDMITAKVPDVVVCESYKLQPGKAAVQAYSAMETSQLIGYLRMACWRKRDFVFQEPKDKVRVNDDVLVYMGILELQGKRLYCMGRQTNDHMRDAIRHGVYYHRYGSK